MPYNNQGLTLAFIFGSLFVKVRGGGGSYSINSKVLEKKTEDISRLNSRHGFGLLYLVIANKSKITVPFGGGGGKQTVDFLFVCL